MSQIVFVALQLHCLPLESSFYKPKLRRPHLRQNNSTDKLKQLYVIQYLIWTVDVSLEIYLNNF